MQKLTAIITEQEVEYIQCLFYEYQSLYDILRNIIYQEMRSDAFTHFVAEYKQAHKAYNVLLNILVSKYFPDVHEWRNANVDFIRHELSICAGCEDEKNAA